MCSRGWSEISKKIRKLHNDYPLAPDEIEIQREMLPEYQIKITYLYNAPTGNVKKVPNIFASL